MNAFDHSLNTLPTQGESTETASGERLLSETPQVLLEHYLKALRLPTFGREYDKVSQQCARQGLDHPRFLLRLCELEVLDRQARAMGRRIRNARFPVIKSLDSFHFPPSPRSPKTWC